ncbi:MAG: hypothetical protein J6T16_06175 [Opitutales bacterium]|nr:hypothetical protein [Opitutales bacterium]
MKRRISYFILLGAAAICFASAQKEELWQKYINASQKENIIPANVDLKDWIKEIQKRTFFILFFTGTNDFYYILGVDESSMSGSCPANSKNKIEDSFLDYTTPFVKDKIVSIELILTPISNSNPLNSIYFKSQFAYAKNLLEIKTFYTENEGKEDEAYVYISTSNKEYKR